MKKILISLFLLGLVGWAVPAQSAQDFERANNTVALLMRGDVDALDFSKETVEQMDAFLVVSAKLLAAVGDSNIDVNTYERLVAMISNMIRATDALLKTGKSKVIPDKQSHDKLRDALFERSASLQHQMERYIRGE